MEAVHSAEDALIRIKSLEFDVVVAEQRLPALSGTDLLLFLQRYAPDAVRVLLTTVTQTSALKRAQASANADHVILRTDDSARWCEELKSLLVGRGLLPETSDGGTVPSASRVVKQRNN